MTIRDTGPILITGCSTGIGRATALRLVAKGYTVYATARNVDTLAEIAAAGATTLPLDVCDEESMVAAVRAIEQAHGAVGVLINNAGYGQDGAIEEVPMDAVRRQFETNVFGLVRLTQLVLPAMRERRRGRIINISSMGGKLVFPGGGFYHATKFALEAISDALRFEVRGFGIDVVIIEPGGIKTAFGDTYLADTGGGPANDASPYATFNAGVAERVRKSYAGSTAGTPEDAAGVIKRAVAAKRPRTRYPVTVAARVMLAARGVLPDRAFDAVLRTQFPAPKP